MSNPNSNDNVTSAFRTLLEGKKIGQKRGTISYVLYAEDGEDETALLLGGYLLRKIRREPSLVEEAMIDVHRERIRVDATAACRHEVYELVQECLKELGCA